jgi:predicted O-methyltransferase YrrM
MMNGLVAEENSMPTRQDVEQFIKNAGVADIVVFGGRRMGGIHVNQVPDEMAGMIHDIMMSKSIDNYLEIGVAAGGTTFLINHFLQPSKTVLIDDNAHPQAFLRHKILEGIEYTEIIGHSHTEGTVNILRSLGLTFDLIFIDANHIYEAVRGDVDIYKHFLRIGGLMALHDTALSQYGPMQTVNEMRTEPWWEFVAEYVTRSKVIRPCGITVFRRIAI